MSSSSGPHLLPLSSFLVLFTSHTSLHTSPENPTALSASYHITNSHAHPITSCIPLPLSKIPKWLASYLRSEYVRPCTITWNDTARSNAVSTVSCVLRSGRICHGSTSHWLRCRKILRTLCGWQAMSSVSTMVSFIIKRTVLVRFERLYKNP